MLVCVFHHLIAHETAGAARIRLSLRPLLFRGCESTQSSGASRREIAKHWLLSAIGCLNLNRNFTASLPATNAKRLRKGALLSAEARLRAKADATKQSSFRGRCAEAGLLRGACHRARIRATRWLAM